MAARQRARLPPTRMLNRGARGPCHGENNSTGGRGRETEGVAPRHPLQLGTVRCSLGGLSSHFNSQSLDLLMEGRTVWNQHVCHKMKINKCHIKGSLGISVPSELCAFVEASHLLLIPLIITHISFLSPDPRILHVGLHVSACLL